MASPASKVWVGRARQLLSVVALLGAWEINARVTGQRLTPTLDAIAARLYRDVVSGDLFFHAQLTVQRGLLGLLIATVAGLLLGFLMARNRWIDAILEPFLGGTYPVPKLALYPVMILLLGLGAGSKVALVALECLYPIAYNTYAGARRIDRSMIWTARNAGASGMRTFVSVVLPGTLGSIVAGLRIASPIMLIIIVVAEMIGETRGLGFLLMDAQARFRPEGAYAVIVVLGLTGYLLDRLIVAAGNRFVFWEQSVRL